MKRFKRPNVLIIYTDQQRLDSLGVFNDKAITPNIDYLAEQGTNLEHYFVNSPVCMPSRMSMLTGRYCSSLGIGHNGYTLPKTTMTLNKLLKPYGYDTAQIGKLHFEPHAKRQHKNPSYDYGFDTFILSDEPGCYDDAYSKWVESIEVNQLIHTRTDLPPAAFHYGQKRYCDVGRETHEPFVFKADGLHHSDFVTSEVCNYLENKSGSRTPFFMIAGFYAPHTPVNPPQKFLDLYGDVEMDLPMLGKETERLEFLRDVTDDEWKEIVRHYLALVSHVDDCVGKILSTLKKSGLYEDTLIVFTSDHGEYLGDYGKIQKGMPQDCIINVPCIFSYPNIIEKQLSSALVESVDIVPTILDFCGIQQPDYVQGISLKPLLKHKKNIHKGVILTELFDHKSEHVTLIRSMNYKYVVWSDGSESLFDLESDPKELNNVANTLSYKDIQSEMRYKMTIKLRQAAYKVNIRDAEY